MINNSILRLLALLAVGWGLTPGLAQASGDAVATASWSQLTTPATLPSGTPFQYMLTVGCSSPANEADAACNGAAGPGNPIVISIPFPAPGAIFPSADGTTTIAGATPVSQWAVAINGGAGVLVSSAVTVTATGWEFSINALPPSANAVTVTFTITPPTGYTPDQTTWTLPPPQVLTDTSVTYSKDSLPVTYTATATATINLALYGNPGTTASTLPGVTVTESAWNYQASALGAGVLAMTPNSGTELVDFSGCTGVATTDPSAFDTLGTGTWNFDAASSVLTVTGLNSLAQIIYVSIPVQGIAVGTCTAHVTWSYLPIGTSVPLTITRDFPIVVTTFIMGTYFKSARAYNPNGTSLIDVSSVYNWSLGLGNMLSANDFVFSDILPTLSSRQTNSGTGIQQYAQTTYCSPGGRVMLLNGFTSACPITAKTPATSADDLAYRVSTIQNYSGVPVSLAVTFTDGSTQTVALAFTQTWNSGDSPASRIDPAVAAITVTGNRAGSAGSVGIQIGGYYPGTGSGLPGAVTPSTVSNTATFTVTDPNDSTTTISNDVTASNFLVSEVVEAQFYSTPPSAAALENPSNSPLVGLTFPTTVTNAVDSEFPRMAVVLPNAVVDANGKFNSYQDSGGAIAPQPATVNTAWSAVNAPDSTNIFTTWAGTGGIGVGGPSGSPSVQINFTLNSLADPGVYPVTYYVGFPGKTFSDAADVVNMFGVGQDVQLMCGGNGNGTPGTVITDTTGILGPDTVGVPTDVCMVQGLLVVAGATPKYSLNKEVRGNGDTNFVAAPGTANVSSNGGGTAVYRLTYVNLGSANLLNNVIYDVLPQTGDTYAVGTLAGTARGSQFAVTLTAAPTVPAGWTVYYSQSETPDRPELELPGTDDWTSTAPTTAAGWALVKALKFVSPAAVTPASLVQMTFPVTLPAFTAPQVAWNTAAVAPLAGTTTLSVIETLRVGLGFVPLADPTDPSGPPDTVPVPTLREALAAMLGVLLLGAGVARLRGYLRR